ncbi:MAG TPA: hypothetical protein VEJ86_06525, partial [Candidatus Binataceae bacterium]|nr:hypothetical protein [Candidatus Binataceae bacterium]
MDTSRVLLAVILSLGLIFAYQELVLKRFNPQPTAETQPSATATSQATAAGLGAPTAPVASTRLPAAALGGATRP